VARIRTLKPEFWTDEKLAPLPPIDRLVFIGLISQADDAGRLVDNVRLLDGLLFPMTNDTCEPSLETLARLSRIIRYTSSSGQKLIQITNWSDHQRVDKPSKHVLPAPTDEQLKAVLSQQFAKGSRDSREDVARVSRDTRAPTLDLGPRTNDLGTDTEAKASEAAPRDEKQPSEPSDAPPRRPSANGKRDLPDMAWGEFVGALKRAVEVHCWRQAQVPEVVVAGDASWTMDREISIAAALVREHELTGAEMLGAISVARETLGLPDKPITLRIFRGGKNGPGKFRDCLHEYRKREARRAQDDSGAPTSMASVLAGLGVPVVS